MSYLNALRLHFSGQFQANVSTVNNDPGHFDNAAFEPGYQQLQGINMFPANGWFNPQGDAAWRLLGCAITAAWMPTPTSPSAAVPASDPVLGFSIADSDARAPAKLVDLDSEQQMVSEIWGLEVRIADANGNTLLRGQFEPAAFIDIWNRATGSGGGDMVMGAMYQSVLTSLVWGDVSASPFLQALQAASAASGLLSIKFNVDGINMNYDAPDFMCGRIAGTIGPAAAGEPHHFVAGRQFMATVSPQNPVTPQTVLNFCAAVVDASNAILYLDLGNALPTTIPGGPPVDLGDLVVSVLDPIATPGNPAGTATQLATIASAGSTGYIEDPAWYATTAGVVALSFDPTHVPLVQAFPLAIHGSTPSNGVNATISEAPTGAFVRADTYVWRASPGDTLSIPVFATRFGQPMQGAVIDFVADASQLQPSNSIDPNDVPPVATPLSAIGFASATTVLSATTGSDGWATLGLPMTDPGTPRWFNGGADYGIDGQVYGVRPSFANAQDNGPVNPWNFISILLWSGFTLKTPGAPTWFDDLQPIFRQYANLYPVMNRFLNLGDYASVVANQRLLLLAFGLDTGNPNVMPVTRDLSPAKRQAILQWLQQSPPPQGTPPVIEKAARLAKPAAAPPSVVMPKGGKTAALARRVVVQSHTGDTP